MSLIRWRSESTDPFAAFDELQDQINRLFEGNRYPEASGIFEQSYSPALDVLESRDGYELECDLPGIDIGDIDISIAGSVVTLKGEKKRGERKEGTRVYREELRGGRFQRTVQLPLPVDPDKVEATLRDGVLRVRLPKREELKPRQISVKAN